MGAGVSKDVLKEVMFKMNLKREVNEVEVGDSRGGEELPGSSGAHRICTAARPASLWRMVGQLGRVGHLG